MQKRVVIDTNIWVKAMVDKEYEADCDDAIGYFFRIGILFVCINK